MIGRAFRVFHVLAAVIGSAALFAQIAPVDAANSKITVYVSKAGLFSAFGDNHEVAAPISAGSVDESTRKVTLVIEASRLKVLDAQLAADKREQVQQRMLGPEVLDVARFPQIKFESTTVSTTANGRLNVEGQLSLHGGTRPVVLNVRNEKGHYIGTCTIKQRDFGITPVTVGGGAVKVKDELMIEFDILLQSSHNHQPPPSGAAK